MSFVPKTRQHYWGMYGLLFEQEHEADGHREKFGEALLFLKRKNSLYTTFLANYETLYGHFKAKMRALKSEQWDVDGTHPFLVTSD